MLKMPALIREWKAVCALLQMIKSGLWLICFAGREEELDQMAQIRSRVPMGLSLIMYENVTETTLSQTYTVPSRMPTTLDGKRQLEE